MLKNVVCEYKVKFIDQFLYAFQTIKLKRKKGRFQAPFQNFNNQHDD